jgi:hypothetical protein
MLKKLAGEVITEIIRYGFFAALAFLVVITSLLAKPQKSILGTEFPPPLGARLIAWRSVGAWLVLGLAAFAVGWLLLSILFALAPLYTLWRWPESISIDELRIHQSAWGRRDVSLGWRDVKSIELSKGGDTLLLRGDHGEMIGISASQVGVNTLLAEITRRTGIPCPAWPKSVDVV